MAVTRVDGSADPIRLRRRWHDDDTEAGQATLDIQHGDHTYAGIDELGWRQPLETYRPLLTANDLGQLVSSRSVTCSTRSLRCWPSNLSPTPTTR
ncbi:hypothetical protein Acsp01_53830 [Actinoplanes sp. NBRC 101535]|nr:hypothetical protein Acsp01_53830 [Actinoplanes sp. NBRC 101535]